MRQKNFSKRGQVTNSQNMGNLDFVTSWTPQGLPSETSPHNATGKDHNPRDCLAGEPGMWAAKAYMIIQVANFVTTSKWRCVTFHRLNLHPQSRLADRKSNLWYKKSLPVHRYTAVEKKAPLFVPYSSSFDDFSQTTPPTDNCICIKIVDVTQAIRQLHNHGFITKMGNSPKSHFPIYQQMTGNFPC